ncbi:MAG TPA: O-antigen ligase family protein [Verrucomicrobiae bacterium]
MRVLITYAILIPLAIFMGYLMTEVGNHPDYNNLFFVGLIAALVLSPILIKWHYPIMVFALGCPMYLFFLKGYPPVAQVMVILSLGIAIVERALNKDRHFISMPSMTWPLVFIVGMAITTAELTGGIGLHTLGASVVGGKKYVALFIGVATYFVLTSRPIPKAQRGLYIALLFLAGFPAFISDLFPVLAYPLDYINLLFPPSSTASLEITMGTTRLGAFSTTALVVAYYMLAKFGLRGIFLGGRLWRPVLFAILLVLTMLGGFRLVFIGVVMVLTMLFFLEGLHRTRLLLVFVMGGLVCAGLLVPLSDKLPYTFQRAMSFLPLKWDASAKADAEGSLDWRLRMWHDLWPQVPQHLLLGKGYALSEMELQQNTGYGTFAGGDAAQMNASQDSLAITGDYHNGPLSVLLPFGMWGAIGFLWFTLAGLRIVYRNYKYGDPELKPANALILALNLQHFIAFFFLFGAFSDDMFSFAKFFGFSVALNWGMCGPKPQTAAAPRVKPLKPFPRPQPLPA